MLTHRSNSKGENGVGRDEVVGYQNQPDMETGKGKADVLIFSTFLL